MNKFFIVAVLAFFSACSSNSKNPAQPKNKSPSLLWLHTEDNKIVDENGETRILRGVNRSGLEYDKRGAGINQVEIHYIVQDWKAQIIRLPFNQEWIMTDDAYNNFFDQVIGWITDEGAYVLLDLQWQDVNVKIPPIPNKQAIEMWKKIAGRYKDNPAVLYDIHNEAHNTTWAAWRARASEIIEGIRSVHPRSLIIVCGLDWAYDLRGWGQQPLPFENIVYSTHPYPFKAEPWAWDKYFGQFADKIPIFAGEFGGGDKDLDWGRQLIAYFNTKKMGWTAWSWSNQPYLTLDDRRTPTAFGQLVRAALLHHAGIDSSSLRISDIQVLYITANRATINWKTNGKSDSRVYYGLSSAYTDSAYAPAMLMAHTIKLTDLQPASTYHFRVQSRDMYGAIALSKDSTFATLSGF